MNGIYSAIKVLLLMPFLSENDILLVTENSLLKKNIIQILNTFQKFPYNSKLTEEVRGIDEYALCVCGDFMSNYYT